MDMNNRINVDATRVISGVRTISRYDPRERNQNPDKDKESFEEKRKEVANRLAKEKPLDVRPQGYQYKANKIKILNKNLQVETYDFLKEENIQTVAFNFVISLRLHGKRFLDNNDNFVLEKKSDFFGEYGEKLINLECDKREAQEGGEEYYGLDEIIQVKKEVYKKLNDYLQTADLVLDGIIKEYPQEWESFLKEKGGISSEIREFKIISIKENFFVNKIKEEIKENGFLGLDDVFYQLDKFLTK